MRINKLNLTYENTMRSFEFKPGVNLIFSKKNSVGKSTLLRLLVYSLGYPVPGTKGIKFNKVQTEVHIYNHKNESTLKRRNDLIEMNDSTYYLPSQEINLLHELWGSDNLDIVKNILGSIYLDQEKGWTLLNRGKVIGNISFNLLELVRGLSNRDLNELILKKESINQEIKKYKTLLNAQSLIDTEKTNDIDDYDDNDIIDTLKNKKIVLNIKIKQLQSKIKNIDNAFINNMEFVKYIENMKLYIDNKGEHIQVTKDNLVNFEENNGLIQVRKNQYLYEISELERKKDKVQELIDIEISKLNVQTEIEKFDEAIRKLNINSIKMESILTELNQERSKLTKIIKNKTIINNNIINSLYLNIKKYATELNVDNYINESEDFIFTDDLKSLSGAVLHLLVFTFKISYILEIEKILGHKLPIILDSPTGREVDQKNIQNMITILNRDFSENQIIIASIVDNFNIDNINKIEIQEGLFKDLDI